MEHPEISDWLLVSERIETVLNALSGIYGRLRLKEEIKAQPDKDLISSWTIESAALGSIMPRMKEHFSSKNYGILDGELSVLEEKFRTLLALERTKYSEIYAGQ